MTWILTFIVRLLEAIAYREPPAEHLSEQWMNEQVRLRRL